MVWLNQVKTLLVIAFAYLIYTTFLDKSISKFVPYNSFEVPQSLSSKEWQQLNDKFGTLIQVVNTTTFSVAYQLNNMTAALLTILNNVGIGSFVILSVGTSSPLTLTDVVIQDVNSLAVTRFARVDFIVESMNPFIISRVVLTPDKQYISSQDVTPRDKLRPNFFRLENELSLFSPYKTSDNSMMLTNVDKQMFLDTITEKDKELANMAESDSVTAGSVAVIPAMNLPTASQVSSEIVGAGILHPVGL